MKEKHMKYGGIIKLMDNVYGHILPQDTYEKAQMELQRCCMRCRPILTEYWVGEIADAGLYHYLDHWFLDEYGEWVF
jgi:hypothetical protein|nr:MAG TPA: hypothetical protein [Caudoviricetes sp.]